MPAYLLQAIPGRREHPAWQASRHNYQCIAVAPDEPTARRNADHWFRRSEVSITAGEPWSDPELTCLKQILPLGEVPCRSGEVLPVMDWVVR